MIKKFLAKGAKSLGYKIISANPSKRKPENKIILGIELNSEKHNFCFEGLPMLKDLGEKLHANLVMDGDGKLKINIGNITYNVTNWEEIHILHEVFVQGIYNYETSKDFLFIDIGMNVGTTSLYFADNPLCKEVHSFEPFAVTLDKANQNLALNISQASKIKVNDFGLGFPARSLIIDYAPELKGSVGIHGVSSHIKRKMDTISAELKIEDVFKHISSIIENSQLEKVIKIDAEGVEYEILERFKETGLLTAFDAYLIEWHAKGPGAISDELTKAGYKLLSFTKYNTDIGMLYAFKR